MRSSFSPSDASRAPYFFTACGNAPSKARERTLRIATLNAYYANDTAKIADGIMGNENLRAADMILLQEVEAHPHEERSRAEKIAAACGFDCVYAPAREAGRGGSHGLAILSKVPVEDIDVIPLGYQNLVFRSRRRIVVTCKANVGGELVRVYNVHLDTRINADARMEQLKPVLDDALRFPADKIVVAGDFNTVPVRWIGNSIPIWYANQRYAIDAHVSRLGFETAVFEQDYTMSQGPLKMRLDSIYTRGVRIGSSGIEHGLAVSDHKPMWADIAWDA